jgi:phage tail protein X
MIRSIDGPDEDLASLVPWLAAEGDQELRAALRAAVAAIRSAKPDLELWEDWEPGDLVSHPDAFPATAWESIEWRDKTWWIDDLHCVDPLCGCTDVRFAFARADDGAADGGDPFAGTLVVTLPDLAPHHLEVANGHLADPDELLALWHEFRSRHHDLLPLLTKRREQMKALRPPNTTTVVRSPKVGRNDPCTCGSGKKYKKCCGR